MDTSHSGEIESAFVRSRISIVSICSEYLILLKQWNIGHKREKRSLVYLMKLFTFHYHRCLHFVSQRHLQTARDCQSLSQVMARNEN